MIKIIFQYYAIACTKMRLIKWNVFEKAQDNMLIAGSKYNSRDLQDFSEQAAWCPITKPYGKELRHRAT